MPGDLIHFMCRHCLKQFFTGIESLNLSLIKMKKYYSRQPVLFFFFFLGGGRGRGGFIKEKRVVIYILPIDLEMPINGGRWVFEEFYWSEFHLNVREDVISCLWRCYSVSKFVYLFILFLGEFWLIKSILIKGSWWNTKKSLVWRGC